MNYEEIKTELNKNFKFKFLNGFYLYYVDGFFHIHTVDEKLYIGDFLALVCSHLKVINIIMGTIFNHSSYTYYILIKYQIYLIITYINKF